MFIVNTAWFFATRFVRRGRAANNNPIICGWNWIFDSGFLCIYSCCWLTGSFVQEGKNQG